MDGKESQLATDTASKPIGLSQVASVGFNTLKKWNTNSTQHSEATSTKSSALSRLFTRNRSSTTDLPVDSENAAIDRSSDEHGDTSSLLESKRQHRLRFPRKLKLSNKSSKPDLKIQTNSNNIDLLSKRPSFSSIDDVSTLRRDSVSSPNSTIHKLFHRSQIPNLQAADVFNKDEGSSSRKVVGLSSNNSNSVITDVNFALVYKFTNPDYSLEEPDCTGEHSTHNTLLDIHKKYLVPADQFIQAKLNSRQSSNNQEIGLGIWSETRDADQQIKLLEVLRSNNNFYDTLMEITKPLYLKSQERSLLNGFSKTYIGCTIEEISAFLKHNYIHGSTSSFIDPEVPSPSRKLRLKPKTTKINRSNSFVHELNHFSELNFDDYKLREISQDLATYFSKGLTLLQKDFEHMAYKNKEVMQDKATGYAKIESDWAYVIDIWEYFNKNIRYFLLACFQPLQQHFHDTSVLEKSKSIEIESILLLAFKDSILEPNLSKRLTKFREIGRIFVLNAEERVLLENPKLLNKIIECLGVICSYTMTDAHTDDGSISDLINKTLDWLIRLRSFKIY